MGMILIGNYAGGAVSPILAGRIFDTTGSYRWAFVICVVISFAAVVATSFLKPVRRKKLAIERR